MSAAALARKLADLGATVDVIVAALEALELKQAEVDAHKAAARERKQKQRERDKERDGHGTVTGQSRDPAVTPSLSLPPSPQTPQPPTHTHPGDITTHAREASKTGDFDEFWTTYPRSEGKAAARKAYPKALTKISHPDLMANLRRLLPSMAEDPQYAPHASTWLNGERWEDEPTPRQQARSRVALAVVPLQSADDIERRRKADAEWRERQIKAYS